MSGPAKFLILPNGDLIRKDMVISVTLKLNYIFVLVGDDSKKKHAVFIDLQSNAGKTPARYNYAFETEEEAIALRALLTRELMDAGDCT